MNTYHNIFLFIAVLVPGLPQILRQKPRLLDGLLFLLGIGTLLGIIISLVFLPFHAEPLEHFVGLSVFEPTDIYPLQIKASAESPETLIPIHAGDEPLLVRQPHFWKLFSAYISLYVICALFSFWEQWKLKSELKCLK